MSLDASAGRSRENRSGINLNQIISASEIQHGNPQIYLSRDFLEVIPENPKMEESQIIDNQVSPGGDEFTKRT